jgi:hypothetical protein
LEVVGVGPPPPTIVGVVAPGSSIASVPSKNVRLFPFGKLAAVSTNKHIPDAVIERLVDDQRRTSRASGEGESRKREEGQEVNPNLQPMSAAAQAARGRRPREGPAHGGRGSPRRGPR